MCLQPIVANGDNTSWLLVSLGCASDTTCPPAIITLLAETCIYSVQFGLKSQAPVLANSTIKLIAFFIQINIFVNFYLKKIPKRLNIT